MSDNYDYLSNRSIDATDNYRRLAGDNSIEFYTKSKLLALNLANTNKDFAKQKYIKLLGSAEVSSELNDRLNLMEELLIATPRQLIDLPVLATFISFKFKLDAPYISRDDDDFYIIDNPIHKDKVFKVPMISPASWKGNLRWVAMKLLEFDQHQGDELIEKRLRIVKLFGNENETDKKFMNGLMGEDEKANYEREIKKITKNDGQLAGRLLFYPTFFNQIGLEVINPHSRETRTGTNPIYFETVPAGASGTFSLLYHPFSLIGKDDGTEEIKKKIKDELIKDVLFLCQILKETMLTYGFSAKKSSGFGIANPDIEIIQPTKESSLKSTRNDKTADKFSQLKTLLLRQVKKVAD